MQPIQALRMRGVSASEAAISAVEARAGSAISNASGQRTALATMIQGMIDDGDWATFDGFFPHALPAQAHALCDFKSTHDASISGALTFTADRGFTGGGASNFLQGTYNPTSHGVNYTQNSAGIYAWDRLGVASGTSANTVMIGASGTVSTLGENSTNVQAGRVNYSSATGRAFGTSATANTAGSRAIIRTASNLITFYKDGSADGTATTASTGIPNSAIISHQDGRQLIIMIVGAGFSSSAVTRINNRVSTWKTAIGA